MSQTSRDRDHSRHVRTHEKNSLRCVRRLGTITQSIFCAQSGAGIGLNFWKWSGESRCPGALSLLLENFRPAFPPDLTDCPWVSEDAARHAWDINKKNGSRGLKRGKSRDFIIFCQMGCVVWNWVYCNGWNRSSFLPAQQSIFFAT